MVPFLAIVGDTWRQSKQQIVFLLMTGFMVLLTLGAIALPKVNQGPEGKPVLGLAWQDPGEAGLEVQWDAAYREALKTELRREERLRKPLEELEAALRRHREASRRLEGRREAGASAEELAPLEQASREARAAVDERREALTSKNQEIIDEAERLIEQRTPGITPLRKGVEMWFSVFVGLLFTLSMWGFIAASAGYFPHMLAAGAVDVLVSKPIGRHVLFFGKYAGGLVLYLLVLLGCYLLAFLGIGLRTGEWHPLVFAGGTLTLYSVALLYGIVAFIGVFTRSTGFAIVIGYAFYFVIDSLVGLLQQVATLEVADTFPVLKSVSEVSRVVFPGFGRLKEAASAAVIDVPLFDPQVLGVAAAWLLGCLALAYHRFRSLDF